MRRQGRSRISADPVVSVGWIFTDLMLALVVILLASQVVVPKKTVAETPKPTPSVKTLATMEKVPRKVDLKVNARGLVAGDPKAIRMMQKALVRETRALRDKQRQAAVVLVWGWSPDTGRGQLIARRVASNLNRGTGQLFKKSTQRELWQGGREGRVRLELYLYEQQRR